MVQIKNIDANKSTKKQKESPRHDEKTSRELKRTWERRLEEAKKKHRPYLKDWKAGKFASSRKDAFTALRRHSAEHYGVIDLKRAREPPIPLRQELSSPREGTKKEFQIVLDKIAASFGIHPEPGKLPWSEADLDHYFRSLSSIDRISCRDLSIEDFVRCYEKPGIPCIISDIPQCEKWQAKVRELKLSSLQ